MTEITPFNTSCERTGFKYDKLIEQFGCTLINSDLIDKFERLTQKPVHFWIRRNLFFCTQRFKFNFR